MAIVEPAVAGDGDAGDAGQGLAEGFRSAGKGGERGDGAELGEKSGGEAGPGGRAEQEGVESVAQGVGAEPHGFGIGDGGDN